MKTNKLICLLLIFHFPKAIFSQDPQPYIIGFETLSLVDSSRTYKPNTSIKDNLHFRPVDLDIWYPSEQEGDRRLKFGELFKLFENRAIKYQDEEDYTGLSNELSQFYVAELGIDGDGQRLLDINTDSFYNLEKSTNAYPLVIYMAGFNGMGFENYRVIEKLAQYGFIVVAIGSVGRYPGNMSNELPDMMEQVYDAEFALHYLKEEEAFQIDDERIGVLGCSWGGMSASVLVDRNPLICAMVSFDGTETTYFGEPGEIENDQFIREIHNRNLLNPANQHVKYLYIESGDKLNEFNPIASYNYFEKLNSEKYYLRILNSSHSDFLCIPSILKTSPIAMDIYSSISETTVHFFNTYLKGRDGFSTYVSELLTRDNITNRNINTETAILSTGLIKGVIYDSKTKQPLPYVNIGILNKEVGTVTNISGEFEFEVGDDIYNDTVRISMIGYEPILLVVNEKIINKKYHLIEMKEKLDELDEIIITAKGYKRKTLGNKTTSKFLSTGFSYNQLGAEMGIKINVKKQPTFVETFNFCISYNRLSAKSIFRLNIYTVENNKPGVNILKENILIPINPKETGVKSINLSHSNIVLTDDVFVTLEWVDTKGINNEGEAIFFSLSLPSRGTIYKASSQARYKKHSSLGVGFNIDVNY